METIMYINALLFFLGICCLVRYAYLRCSDDETETELERNQREADKLAATVDEQSGRLEQGKEMAEGIRETELRIADAVRSAEDAVAEAKERSRTTVELADECISILEEAEKKSKQS